MSRAGYRKKIGQYEDFVKKFDLFVAAGAVHANVKTPDTTRAFEKARDDVAAARNKIGEVK